MEGSYYVIRSRQTGEFLTARQPAKTADEPLQRYLLLFHQDHEALSYLNAHAAGLSDRFAVEHNAVAQLKPLIDRWGFAGVGLVSDPLVPIVDFMERRFL